MRFGTKNNRYLQRIRFYYNLQKLISDWRPDLVNANANKRLKIYNKFHYMGRFFLGENPTYFEIHRRARSSQSYIQELDILKRRSTRSKRCLKESHLFDRIIFEKHLLQHGCRIPYLVTNKSYPLCDTAGKMQNGMFRYSGARSFNIPKSCERIAKLRRTSKVKQDSFQYSKIWYYKIGYPDEFKVIMQSKEFDVHSLIGNIGGYLGLFLGE